MISEDDAVFLLECLGLEERNRDSAYGADDLDVTQDMVLRLRRCADKLNRADSA